MQSSRVYTIGRAARICAMLVSVVSFFPNWSHAQGNNGDVTNGGTDFLLCFMANESSGYDPSPSRYQDIYLASQSDSAIVTITSKAFPKWKHVIQLAPNQGVSYRLSTDPVIGYPTADAIIETSEIIDKTVFSVTSTTPIICYGMSHKQFTCDAFLALPRNTASTEYIVMAYANSTQLTGQEMPSEFSVASFDDDDTVTITPTTLTRNGRPAGNALTFVLNSGEAVQIQSDPFTPLLDLTGSIVRSTKPVVVYGGSQRTEVPNGYFYVSNGNQRTSRDHLAEAIPPLSTWGKFFIAKNFGRAGGDVMRVLASMDNTIVTINGKVWGAPLMARQFRDTIIAQDNSVPANNIFGVETSDPSLVGMIAHSAVDDGGTGDPFLAIIPPLDQTYHDFTYFISQDAAYPPGDQFVIVASEVTGAGAISIDGSIIPKTPYTNVPVLLDGKQYAVATIVQSPGIHRAVSPNTDDNGFTILAYGFGNVDSYGYTAGALLKPIKGIFSETIKASAKISLRNILAEAVTIDSTSISYSNNPKNIAVSLKQNISKSTIEMGKDELIELTAGSEIPGLVTGSVHVYYHTAKWSVLTPADFPFSFGVQSGVKKSDMIAIALENVPNPASGSTTIRFNLPNSAMASVKIFDALGRVVRIVTQSVMSEGAHSFNVNTSGLAAGSYTIELLAPEIGASEHSSMIVLE